ncbi:MAG: Hemerythrin protein [Magnetococcales bacterium]|nr:Hemerythrin protein [Magnetococcales bacterium]HIJ83655.1 hypothetical protein [Magnetococcales bacterium]
MDDLTMLDRGSKKTDKDRERLLHHVQEFNSLCSRFRLRTPFPDEWDQMDAIFAHLDKCSRVHLREETKELTKLGFPTLPDHLRQYQHRVEVLTELKIKVKNREFQAIDAVKMFLLEWISDQIGHAASKPTPGSKPS